jgi:hypothetical protein
MLKYVFRWSSTLPLYGEISSQDATWWHRSRIEQNAVLKLSHSGV